MTDESATVAGAVDDARARELLQRAREARARAYAPYSGFPVGAALLADDGRIFTGVNVENASYGLTTCAERTAVVRAIAEGSRGFTAIAVAGPDDDLACPPCGSCRQILHEASPGMVVITSSGSGKLRLVPLEQLLPSAFDGRRIPGLARPT